MLRTAGPHGSLNEYSQPADASTPDDDQDASTSDEVLTLSPWWCHRFCSEFLSSASLRACPCTLHCRENPLPMREWDPDPISDTKWRGQNQNNKKITQTNFLFLNNQTNTSAGIYGGFGKLSRIWRVLGGKYLEASVNVGGRNISECWWRRVSKYGGCW